MKYTDNAINIITAKTYKGIGRAWINKALKGNESVETIVSLLNNNSKQEVLITIEDFEVNKNKIINQLEVFQESLMDLLQLGIKISQSIEAMSRKANDLFLFFTKEILAF
jgi:DNA processing protein